MSKIIDEIEELTSEILLDSDMYKIPVDVLSIAKANDISIYKGNLELNTSGAIRYNEERKKFEILINENDNKKRQRFTIAHELGHYFLHKDLLQEKNDLHVDIMYRRITDEKERVREKEADYFAGALLINRIFVEKLYKEKRTITELAELFNVSISAMTVRLDVLGLL